MSEWIEATNTKGIINGRYETKEYASANASNDYVYCDGLWYSHPVNSTFNFMVFTQKVKFYKLPQAPKD